MTDVEVIATRLDLRGLLSDPSVERTAVLAAADSALRLLHGPSSLWPRVTGRSGRAWQATIARRGVLAFLNPVRYAPPLERGFFAHGAHRNKARRTVERGIPRIQAAAAAALARVLPGLVGRYAKTTTESV